MTEKQPPPESRDDRAEASEAATPMERFMGLTRRLLKVTPEQLRAEQQRHAKAKETKPA